MVASKADRPGGERPERAEKRAVNISLSVALIDRLETETARRKMDRSALLTEYAEAGLSGGVRPMPAPVVVGLPAGDVERIADALAARLPQSTAREQGNEDDLRGLPARLLEGLTVVSRQLEVVSRQLQIVTAVGRDAERDAETQAKKSKRRWGRR